MQIKPNITPILTDEYALINSYIKICNNMQADQI